MVFCVQECLSLSSQPYCPVFKRVANRSLVAEFGPRAKNSEIYASFDLDMLTELICLDGLAVLNYVSQSILNPCYCLHFQSMLSQLVNETALGDNAQSLTKVKVHYIYCSLLVHVASDLIVESKSG